MRSHYTAASSGEGDEKISHIVSVKVEMKDAEALKRAISRVPGAKLLGEGQHTLYNSQKAEGIGVQLPDWRFPVVINTKSGQAVFDNFGGHWGKQQLIDQLVQGYSVELMQEEAHRRGYPVREELLDNGDIKLTIDDCVTV